MPVAPTMPRRVSALLLLLLLAILPSCAFHRHRVGTGPTGRGEESDRQYYFLFGLLRLNEVDTDRLARGLTSYEIVTERSFVDYLLTPVLMPFTVISRTVTVHR